MYPELVVLGAYDSLSTKMDRYLNFERTSFHTQYRLPNLKLDTLSQRQANTSLIVFCKVPEGTYLPLFILIYSFCDQKKYIIDCPLKIP